MIRARCLVQVISTSVWTFVRTAAAGIVRRVGVDARDALTVSPRYPAHSGRLT